jgi:very-short-patch-repair endonuclease
MLVVSSFSSDEVDLSRSGSRGVELLKKYLRYAELCSSANVSNPDQLQLLKECLLWNSQEAGGTVELNSFESDVRAALEEKGIKTIPQLGVSQYRIDLVAMHPNKPGQPVLAIECDGASYHSSPTARDRDRLRQEHLQRLGWRFHRIWSTDWFHRREEEISRAVAAFDEAVQYFDALEAKARQENALAVQGFQEKQTTKPPLTLYNPGDTNTHNHGDDNVDKGGIANTITQNGNADDIYGSGPQTYDLREPLRKLKRPRIRQCETIDDYTFEELKAIAEWIMSDGLLRTKDEIIQEVFKYLPFKNMGRRIKSRLEEVASMVSKEFYANPDDLPGSGDASKPPAIG